LPYTLVALLTASVGLNPKTDVNWVTDPKLKADLYTLAFTLVRADESVTGAERIYLAQLAHQLGLDATAAARLESEAAAHIDAEAGKTPEST
jgi:uncharacterized membrane protein YebE (DUF533 family)